MELIHSLIVAFTDLFPAFSFWSYQSNVYGSIAIVLVSLICGSVGGLVVGNRMAFFSDALAHCAFAGVALGLLFCLIANVPEEQFRQWLTVVMIGFGVVIGVLIAWVRDRTGLASDTVIGVFFAFAIGLGAVFTRLAGQRVRVFNIESFLFGNPLGTQAHDVLFLIALLVLTILFLVRFHNELILTSVHSSLAQSRRVRVKLLRYMLIVLLGMIVNVCLQVVGTLLINGLLIVPAAAAANVSRNLRQLFWWTLGLTMVSGLGGQYLNWELSNRYGVELGIGGTIVVLCSVLFFVSMVVGPKIRGGAAA